MVMPFSTPAKVMKCLLSVVCISVDNDLTNTWIFRAFLFYFLFFGVTLIYYSTPDIIN